MSADILLEKILAGELFADTDTDTDTDTTDTTDTDTVIVEYYDDDSYGRAEKAISAYEALERRNHVR